MTKSSRGHIIQRRRQIPSWLVGIFAMMGILALVAALAALAPQLFDRLQNPTQRAENRTWLTREWTQSDPSSDAVAALAAQLAENRIPLVYVQAGGWHGQTGEYVELPFAQDFLARLRTASPGLRVYVWIVLPSDQLSTADAQARVLNFAEQAILEYGFDGIHVQARSVVNESPEFVALLRDLRILLGETARISITVPPDRTPLDPDVPATPEGTDPLTWSQEYKRRVLLNVNEIVLMGHASSLNTVDDYQRWLAYQVANYAELIDDLDIPMNYIVALPTYPPELGHDPSVENVRTAVEGIRQGIQRAQSAGDEIDGVGLYPWGQTDAEEFQDYEQTWLETNF